MTVQKIKSGRITSIVADQYIGENGTIFYNESLGDLRLSDGSTLGGKLLSVGSSSTDTSNIDGGGPYSVYGGIDAIDGGSI